ncbi:discoidin domain-containing protein [Agromyces endophyticus]|uniref:discoidin domain-containing protein n=1 Tax=Agromyces sp. H17E-10 TaxID=2932244 RepID=UPI001FD490B5|nr:discoidin domain-containing protein [Agromyces sp. H17E-10]UOQ90071.1 discoidin domain-containing protein [Agromyces sp. H17E-10]
MSSKTVRRGALALALASTLALAVQPAFASTPDDATEPVATSTPAPAVPESSPAPEPDGAAPSTEAPSTEAPSTDAPSADVPAPEAVAPGASGSSGPAAAPTPVEAAEEEPPAEPDIAVSISEISLDGPAILDVEVTVQNDSAKAMTKVGVSFAGPIGWQVVAVDDDLGRIAPGDDESAAFQIRIPEKRPGYALRVFTATAEYRGGDGAGTATETVSIPTIPPMPNLIDQSTLSIADVSSEETVSERTPATNAIDGDTNTIWHTAYRDGARPYPHHITIDLGAEYDVTGLEYVTRQNAVNGRMKDYQVYVSADGTTWGDPVATGSFTADLGPQRVAFAATAGRYVKLVGLNSIAGNAFGGAAEINIGGIRR